MLFYSTILLNKSLLYRLWCSIVAERKNWTKNKDKYNLNHGKLTLTKDKFSLRDQ